MAGLSAGLIFAGACTSVVPGVLHAEQASVKWYAVLLYFLSNVPMACSAVYKACTSLHSSLRHTRGDQALPCWAVLSLSLSLSLLTSVPASTASVFPFALPRAALQLALTFATHC